MLYIDIPFEQATEMVGGLSRSLDSNPGGEGERGENYNKVKTKTRMVQLGESLLTYVCASFAINAFINPFWVFIKINRM